MASKWDSWIKNKINQKKIGRNERANETKFEYRYAPSSSIIITKKKYIYTGLSLSLSGDRQGVGSMGTPCRGHTITGQLVPLG